MDLSDASARDLARLDLGHNIVVEAGAGTGKTTLLIDRILFLLLGRRPGGQPLDITRLVALTFTEKAASEIKLRLAESLHAVASLLGGLPLAPELSVVGERCLRELQAHFPSAPGDRLRLTEKALSELERAQIGTIHAFCSHLLRLYPLEAGLDPEFQVDADLQAENELFESEWALWLDHELGLEAPRAELWKTVLAQATLSDLEDLARGLLSPRVDLSLAGNLPELLLSHAMELLKPFVASLSVTYRRRGFVTFDGLLVSARDLVRGHWQVRSELKRRFDAFLIDEFQDTDPLQGELLMFLAESKDSCAFRWQDTRPEPGKLFLVGDPKQSIYRFRGADVSAMESFVAHLERHGARRSSLQVNFRSSGNIVSAVNNVFERAMRSEPFSPVYQPIHTTPRQPAGFPPEWVQVAPETFQGGAALSAQESRKTEADWIARWVLEHRSLYRLRDIALLLRSNFCLPVYLETFKRSGIPYVVEGEKYFFSTQEVTDVLNLLKAVDDPQDPMALAGLLRSPLTLCTDKDIYRLAEQGLLDYRKRVRGLEPLYRILRRFHEMAGRKGLAELLQAVLEGTWITELSAKAYHHQQTASNLLKLKGLAARQCEQGKTLKEFIAYIAQSVRDLREEGESPLADEHLDAVRVLTIHKAKGLEYPVVFLVNLSGPLRTRVSESALRLGWGEPMLGLRLKSCGAANAAMLLLEAEEERRQRAEEIRVLYVAMTRAKERLFLVGNASWKGFSFSSMVDGAEGLRVSRIPAIQESRFSKPSPSVSQPLGFKPRELAASWKRRMSRASKADKTLFTHPTAELQPFDLGLWQEESPPAFSLETRGESLLLGRLCHLVLERWDFKSSLDQKLPGLDELIERCLKLLDQQEKMPQDSLRQETRSVLGSFLRSRTAQELAQVEILGRELPWVYGENSQVIRGAIDLLYRIGGRIVVADYKTDKVSGAQKALRRAQYQRQGSFYVEAVERSLGVKGVQFRALFLRNP